MNTTENTESGNRVGELEHAIAELCVRVPVSAGAAGLARELSHVAPHFSFRDVLTRGGWYRLGGVIDVEANHVSDDLAHWAEAQFAAHGDDLHALIDAYADGFLTATRLTGKTHYFVAPYGVRADEFIQIEIEELQEETAHVLSSGDEAGSLEEWIDPSRERSESRPVLLGMPFYSLRRVTDVAAFLRRIAAQKPEPQIVHRFFDAWQASSAGATTHFSNHWVVAVREHLDRYRQAILHATPVAALNGLPPRFESVYGARGMALNEALQHFDRQAGYPMAWFFHMLTTKAVPHAVAGAVVDDMQGGFGYLPERDVKTVRDWLHRPYAF